MAWRRIITKVSRDERDLSNSRSLLWRDYSSFPRIGVVGAPGGGGGRASLSQSKFQSSYVGSFARRVRDREYVNELAHMRELYRRNDPEVVIKMFESQPSLHSNASALSTTSMYLVSSSCLLFGYITRGFFTGNRLPNFYENLLLLVPEMLSQECK